MLTRMVSLQKSTEIFPEKIHFEFESSPRQGQSLKKNQDLMSILKNKYPFLDEGQKFLREETQNDILLKH